VLHTPQFVAFENVEQSDQRRPAVWRRRAGNRVGRDMFPAPALHRAPCIPPDSAAVTKLRRLPRSALHALEKLTAVEIVRTVLGQVGERAGVIGVAQAAHRCRTARHPA